MRYQALSARCRSQHLPPTSLARRRVSELVPLLATMTDRPPKFKALRFIKLMVGSLVVVIALLFTVASLRTLSLDVNAGLQLADWGRTRNISLVVDQHRREQLVANFKGNLQNGNDRDRRRPNCPCVAQRRSGSPRCRSRRRRSTPPP